jgi:hypothetical protein
LSSLLASPKAIDILLSCVRFLRREVPLHERLVANQADLGGLVPPSMRLSMGESAAAR